MQCKHITQALHNEQDIYPETACRPCILYRIIIPKRLNRIRPKLVGRRIQALPVNQVYSCRETSNSLFNHYGNVVKFRKCTEGIEIKPINKLTIVHSIERKVYLKLSLFIRFPSFLTQQLLQHRLHSLGSQQPTLLEEDCNLKRRCSYNLNRARGHAVVAPASRCTNDDVTKFDTDR